MVVLLQHTASFLSLFQMTESPTARQGKLKATHYKRAGAHCGTRFLEMVKWPDLLSSSPVCHCGARHNTPLPHAQFGDFLFMLATLVMAVVVWVNSALLLAFIVIEILLNMMCFTFKPVQSCVCSCFLDPMRSSIYFGLSGVGVDLPTHDDRESTKLSAAPYYTPTPLPF